MLVIHGERSFEHGECLPLSRTRQEARPAWFYEKYTLNRRRTTARPLARQNAAWIGTIFGETNARRILVALACSVALHEIVAGIIPPLMHPVGDQKEVVQKVAIVQVSTPKPTPTPRPTPTPTPPHVLRVTPVVPLPQGKAAHKETIKHLGAPRPKPPKLQHTKPIWDYYPMGGHGAGAGKGEGAGSLGNGTSGTGTGASGSGAGGGAPCGAVDFIAAGDPQYDSASGMYERNNVKAIVHYSDGSSQTIDLDWTWRFKSRMDDPWVNSNAPMLFQFPPPSQRASEPDPVQYIMQYSRATGTTKLKEDCPNIPAVETPGP